MKADQDELFNQLSASWKVVTELKEDLRKWEEREQHDERDREMLQRQLTRVIKEKQELEHNIDRRCENAVAENMFLSDENSMLKTRMTNFEQRLAAVQQERTQDRDVMDQNDELLKENVFLSEENATLKNKITNLEHRLIGAQREDGLRQENILLSDECATNKRVIEQLEDLLKTSQGNLTQKTNELNWYRDHNLQRAQKVLRVQKVNVTRYGRCFHFGECQALQDHEHRELEMCSFCATNLNEKHIIMLANRSQILPRG